MIPTPLLNKNHKKVVTRVYKVNPVLAEELLKLNIKENRTPSRKSFYAGMMARNEWAESGETIKFDSMGRLVDGQNRLYAIIESQTIQELEFRFDLPSDSFKYLDGGKGRTLGDRLKTQGYSYYNNLAYVITKIMTIDSPHIFSNHTTSPVLKSSGMINKKNLYIHLSDKEKIDLIPTKYKGLDELNSEYCRRFIVECKSIKPISINTVTAYAYMLSRKSQATTEVIDSFFTKLITGENLSKRSPIFHLRRYIQLNADKKDAATGLKQLNEQKAVKYMLKAFQSYITGREWENMPRLNGETIEELYDKVINTRSK